MTSMQSPINAEYDSTREAPATSGRLESTLPSCTILILNWNGRDLLAEGIPSVLGARSASSASTEILVVDNGSDDESVAFVREKFPDVKILTLDRNIGFGEGNNAGVRHATGDIVVLLNNDMVVEPGFLDPLLLPFADDPHLFAVGSQIFFQDVRKVREETGKTYAYWDKGMIRYLHQEVTALDEQRGLVPIHWASGGAVAYCRKKFLALGGFRKIYSPAYAEDLDLSYRAHRRGWRVVMAPASHVQHKHRASSKKRFDARSLEVLVKRNQLLFLWSNISSWKLLMTHFISLLPRTIWDGFRDRQWIDLEALLAALPRLPRAFALNLAGSFQQACSDRDILCSCSWRASFIASQPRLSILFVCPYVPSIGMHAGGQRMYEVIKGMAAYHDVSVLTYYEDDAEALRLEGLRPHCRSMISIRRGQSNNESDWFHILPRGPVKEFCNPEMKSILFNEVRAGKYDVIQFEYLEMAHLAQYVRTLNVPIILTEHEVQSRKCAQAIRSGALPLWEKAELFVEWMKMTSYEVSAASALDGVIAMTKDERDWLIQYDRTLPVRVNRTGVHIDYFSSYPRVEPDPQSLVFVGYFRHSPNVDAMQWFCATIYPRIQEHYPHVRLFIVGAEPPESIRRLHDGRSVIVTGRVDDIRPWMARGSLYIIPMRLGAGIRGKVLEAWAMKKPIICSPIAASGIMAEDGKNLIIAKSTEEFVRAVVDLFADEEKRKCLGERGHKTALENFDWPRQVKEHAALYREFLQGTRREKG